MKSLIFILLSLLLFANCSPRLNNYYSGIIIDEVGRPVSGVLVEEIYSTNRTMSDASGYFKLNRSNLFELIISKKNYLNDTIHVVGSHAGESFYYSDIVTEDSSEVVIRGINVRKLPFINVNETQPSRDTIIDPIFPRDSIFGIWLSGGDTILDGFKILDKEDFYYLGFEGYRYMRYQIRKDSITLYGGADNRRLKGKILLLKNDSLSINWNNQETIGYKKWTVNHK